MSGPGRKRRLVQRPRRVESGRTPACGRFALPYARRVNRATFVATAVGVPFLSCTVVPQLLFGVVLHQWGTNLLWGLVFGFGWWIAQSIGGPEHWHLAANIGLFLWLPLVLWGLSLAAGAAWRTESKQRRRLFVVLLAASCLPLVPAETAMALYSSARVPPDLNLLIASW